MANLEKGSRFQGSGESTDDSGGEKVTFGVGGLGRGGKITGALRTPGLLEGHRIRNRTVAPESLPGTPTHRRAGR